MFSSGHIKASFASEMLYFYFSKGFNFGVTFLVSKKLFIGQFPEPSFTSVCVCLFCFLEVGGGTQLVQL
jgi:hypothetical protein